MLRLVERIRKTDAYFVESLILEADTVIRIRIKLSFINNVPDFVFNLYGYNIYIYIYINI